MSDRTQPSASAAPELLQARPYCYACLRPAAHCYCESLPAIDNLTKIVIVQHPRERAHAIGTARMARLALKNSELHIDYARRFLTEELVLPPGTGLLYPGPDAQVLEDLDPTQRPSALVVLDGTWHHARYLFRDVPWLQGLPRYSLKPAAPSRYRIRREPAAHCVSTVEAIVLALSALEPNLQGLDALLSSFDRMIDRQIDSKESQRAVGRFKRRRSPRPGAVIDTLRDAEKQLVFVYAETLGGERGKNRNWLNEKNGEKPARNLLSLTAQRAATGETFGMLCQTDQPISEPHLAYLGLSREQFEQGVPYAELGRAFSKFSRADDVLVAWNQSTLDLLPKTQAPQQTLLVKAAYLNQRRFRGALNEIVEHEQLVAAQASYYSELQEATKHGLSFGARALSRIANLRCVVDLLKTLSSRR